MPDRAAGPAGESARRMRAIAAELAAAGLAAQVHDTRGVLDVRATAHEPGSKTVEVIVDVTDRPCECLRRPASLILAA